MIGGIERAARDAAQQQCVRFGYRWLLDATGSKALVRPRDLSTPLFLWWIESAAYRYGCEIAGTQRYGTEESNGFCSDRVKLAAAAESGAAILSIRPSLGRNIEMANSLLDGAALTPSQTRILTLLDRGLSVREVGEKLRLSPSTVRVHLHAAR